MDNRYFPIFVPSAGRKVFVAGGGAIATRRVSTLMQFDFEVTVAAPEASEQIRALAEAGRLQLITARYEASHLADCFMALACTDDRAVNRQIGLDAKARGILVSVCDAREECSFYFPAVAAGEKVTCGIVGTGKDHSAVRRTAEEVREIVKGKAY